MNSSNQMTDEQITLFLKEIPLNRPLVLGIFFSTFSRRVRIVHKKKTRSRGIIAVVTNDNDILQRSARGWFCRLSAEKDPSKRKVSFVRIDKMG